MYSMPLFGPAIFVATTKSALLCLFLANQVPIKRSVLPKICSLPPIGYISAVSMKFIPRSTA